ncbi:tellurite resistance TerB family protein [Neptunomonas antarctica]|uniref:Tellurite resistance protein TerB n=1 Tax=Neptunomonas antarctica TaxID=619304 RepID=A0A1N7IY38_9GAMM|nr:tellurite resistance TerB family protein [Neptunomonas antarctica]SIS41911.1 tellurite resistance protein TerB [Neptunomonas antarctica]
MSFSSFMSTIKQKSNELKGEVLKFKNKKFLNAATAGTALIARADGDVSSEEKKKMLKIIESNDALSVFKTSDVIEAFNGFLSNFEFDLDVGESKAFEALNLLKGDDVACRTVMRLILSIAAADGVFDDDEKAVARKVARELGLDAADFEL